MGARRWPPRWPATCTRSVIRALAYLLEFDGWRTIYLGSDVPKTELPAAIDCFDADIVLLSLALSSQLPALRRTITEIRDKSGDRVMIMVGGNGLAGAPDLWRDVGADGYAATVDEALVVAAELTGSDWQESKRLQPLRRLTRELMLVAQALPQVVPALASAAGAPRAVCPLNP